MKTASPTSSIRTLAPREGLALRAQALMPGMTASSALQHSQMVVS